MIYAIAAGFIVLDLITGVIKALKNKNFTSSNMRNGLFHKTGSLLCIVFGVLVDYAQTHIDIGVSIPCALAICSYIAIMEVGSIIENICAINPEIMPDKLKGFFSKINGGDEK